MAKISAKNGILLFNGNQFSTYGRSYEASQSVNPVDVTGFSDARVNYIPGLVSADISIDMMWDSTATPTNPTTVLRAFPSGIVTILPEGGTLPVGLDPIGSLSMPYIQGNFMPRGEPTGAIELGTLQLWATGATCYGLEHGWLLYNGTITNTTTGAESQDPSLGAVTAIASATLQIYTATTTDSYVVKVQHATTSGGAYADLITFTANGQTRTAERQVVASGTINRYRRILATRTGAAGDPFGFAVHFWHS